MAQNAKTTTSTNKKVPNIKTLGYNQAVQLTKLFVNKNTAPHAKTPYTFNGEIQYADQHQKPTGYISSVRGANGHIYHYQKLSRDTVNALYQAGNQKVPTDNELNAAIVSKQPLISTRGNNPTKPINFVSNIESKNGFKMIDPKSIKAPQMQKQAKANQAPKINILAKHKPLILTTLFARENKSPHAKNRYSFNGLIQFTDQQKRPNGYISSSRGTNGKVYHYQKLTQEAVKTLYASANRSMPTPTEIAESIKNRQPLINSYAKDNKRPINFVSNIETKNGFRMMDPTTIQMQNPGVKRPNPTDDTAKSVPTGAQKPAKQPDKAIRVEPVNAFNAEPTPINPTNHGQPDKPNSISNQTQIPSDVKTPVNKNTETDKPKNTSILSDLTAKTNEAITNEQTTDIDFNKSFDDTFGNAFGNTSGIEAPSNSTTNPNSVKPQKKKNAFASALNDKIANSSKDHSKSKSKSKVNNSDLSR